MRPLFFALFLLPLLAAGDVSTTDLYTGSGHSPDHTYRIPTLAVSKKGTLLAFAEQRKNNGSDTGDIDTVVKRSEDHGKTWSAATTVLDSGNDTIGNACPIVDPATGRITVVATWNRLPEKRVQPGFGEDSRRVFVTHSDDDGLTWSDSREITREVKQPTWSWFATGPCAGIMLGHGPHRGRYIVGVNHLETAGEQKGYFAHVIYSDDAGITWKSSNRFVGRDTNECEAVELADGSLLLNARNHGSAIRDRALTVSRDGGETWGETRRDPLLPEPQCMGSTIRHSLPHGDQPGLILFCNPASRSSRSDLVLRGSRDEGVTWPLALPIKSGDAAYSHLAVLADGTIAIAYETDHYSRIAFATVQPADLQSAPKVLNADGTLKEKAAR
ncbi:MAG: sialidase family protein [Luteolibacter sp.]